MDSVKYQYECVACGHTSICTRNVIKRKVQYDDADPPIASKFDMTFMQYGSEDTTNLYIYACPKCGNCQTTGYVEFTGEPKKGKKKKRTRRKK